MITGTGVKRRFYPPKTDGRGYRDKPISAPLPRLITRQTSNCLSLKHALEPPKWNWMHSHLCLVSVILIFWSLLSVSLSNDLPEIVNKKGTEMQSMCRAKFHWTEQTENTGHMSGGGRYSWHYCWQLTPSHTHTQNRAHQHTHHKTLVSNFFCCDITNNRFGISEESVPEGGNLHIYCVQSHHLVSGGSNIWVRCVTPHSSPARGCWSQ